MSFSDLSLYIWGYALLTVIYLLIRILFKSIPTTSYKIWYDKNLSLDYLKTWGCPTYVKKQMADKLEDRSVTTHFIGYLKETIGYYFYLPQDHNVIVSHHAKFLKNQFIEEEDSGRLIELEEKVSEEQRAIDPQEPIIHEPVVDIPPPPHRSNRVSHPP